MSVYEEKMQILKMIEEGKIDSSEGLELLEAIENKGEQELKPSHITSAKWLRVRVKTEDDKTKVNVNIPVSLVDVGFKIAKAYSPELNAEELKNIDLDEIIKAIKNGAEGKLVDIYDEENNTKVEVFVE
ncbi:MAG: SHOCT-like domain-containing protein [Halothermotrichaceae bacterium]